MMDLFGKILGKRFLFDHVLMLNRPAGSKGRRWHAHPYRQGQHEVQDPIGTGKFVTKEFLHQQCIRTLCYPEGASIENGCEFAVSPGSHLYRIPFKWSTQRPDYDDDMEKSWLVGKTHPFTGEPLKIHRLSISWYTLFNGGDAWSSQIARFYDVVDKSFAPSNRRSDVVIAPGTYKFTTIRTGPRPSGSRRIRPEFHSKQAPITLAGDTRSKQKAPSVLQVAQHSKSSTKATGSDCPKPTSASTLSAADCSTPSPPTSLSNYSYNGTTMTNPWAQISCSTTAIAQAATSSSFSTAVTTPHPQLPDATEQSF
jgi:hypothetical protein